MGSEIVTSSGALRVAFCESKEIATEGNSAPSLTIERPTESEI